MEPARLEDLRLAVYREFAANGHAPSDADLAAATELDEPAVRAGLQELAQARHLAFGHDGAIALAHPFAGGPFGFSVMGRRTLWWGGCCWDSFAIPNLVPGEPEALVATICPGCGRALAWTVTNQAPPDGEEVAHFLVPMANVWDDVLRACANQRIFCDEGCLDRWLAEHGETRGYLMDLAQLWRLARGWYAGRLDRGYVRREPSAAREYFREAGLSGPFWGL